MKRFSKLYLYTQKRNKDVLVEPFLKKYGMPRLDADVKEYLDSKIGAYEDKAYDTWNTDITDSTWTKNERTIFVLIDKGIYSSGESFVEQLSTIDNVIFVGSNTAGCTAVGDMQSLFLPKTNIQVRLGAALNVLRNEPYVIDGRGYDPDIWLDNEDIVDRVLALAKKSNLVK